MSLLQRLLANALNPWIEDHKEQNQRAAQKREAGVIGDEHGPAAVGNPQSAPPIFLDQTTQNEAEDKRRRLAIELLEKEAEDRENSNGVDFKRAVADRVRSDARLADPTTSARTLPSLIVLNTARVPQTVHALERGLSLLAAINEFAPATLSILVDATGLPKATVVRLLHTLREAGYVEHAENAGYRLLPRIRNLFSSIDRESAPTQTIRRLLNDFASVVKWPAEFMIREGATMLIEVSNRDSAPIALRRFEHLRFPLLHSASGIALLAWSKPRPREEIIRSALLQEKASERGDVASTTRRKISEALARGYSVHDYNTPIEGTRAISVPVYSGDTAVAAMALIFLRDALPQSQVDNVLVPKLREVSANISLHYSGQ